MKTRSVTVTISLLACLAVIVLLFVRPFETSMALVFAVLALISGTIARDAFVPYRTDDR